MSARTTTPPVQQERWQRELAAAVRCSKVLLERLQLDPALLASEEPIAKPAFPVMVPENYLQRMQPGNPRDPLLLQVLPRTEEQLRLPGFSVDAVGDLEAQQTAGLLQKYHGRVLLITTGACAIHCRYCFRQSFPYSGLPVTTEQWLKAMRAIQADSSISEVILSGGDPLVLTDGRLEKLIQELEQIPHLQRLRIHTRLPIVIPARVTTGLLHLLQRTRLQPFIVIHANHAAELTGDCPAAVQRLVRQGIPILNQAVLLRGVNDTVESLEQLSLGLINLGVTPYYLHQLDRVHGTAHFEVPEVDGRQLIAALAARVPGYAVPRYVREIRGATGKTPVLP